VRACPRLDRSLIAISERRAPEYDVRLAASLSVRVGTILEEGQQAVIAECVS